jgi:SpoVK/Ycf46/Vps4 family AAA+-type ATPase
MPLGRKINSAEDPKAEAEMPAHAQQAPIAFAAEEPKHSFADIILNKPTYDAIQDVLAMYEKRDLVFNQWGLGTAHKQHNRAGINMYGAPGTGKSMAAHAIAHQLKRKILAVDYSQIESKYVGETSKNLVAMFAYAKDSGSVLFFDEADALLSKRVTNMLNSTDVSANQTRSVLLLLIDKYDELILYATNFISNYDPAFMRRMLGHVKFELPDAANRMKLWRMYIPKSLPTDADIEALAAKHGGVSGSDISNAVLSASLRAARLNEKAVRQTYFEEAIRRAIDSNADNEDLGKLVSRRAVNNEYVKSQRVLFLVSRIPIKGTLFHCFAVVFAFANMGKITLPLLEIHSAALVAVLLLAFVDSMYDLLIEARCEARF